MTCLAVCSCVYYINVIECRTDVNLMKAQVVRRQHDDHVGARVYPGTKPCDRIRRQFILRIIKAYSLNPLKPWTN